MGKILHAGDTTALSRSEHLFQKRVDGFERTFGGDIQVLKRTRWGGTRRIVRGGKMQGGAEGLKKFLLQEENWGEEKITGKAST